MATIEGYELAPCPFCGGEDMYIRLIIGPDLFSVTCNNSDCEARGPEVWGKESAIKAWNDQPNIALAERQRAALDMLLAEVLKFSKSPKIIIDNHGKYIPEYYLDDLMEIYRQVSSLSTMTGSSEK